MTKLGLLFAVALLPPRVVDAAFAQSAALATFTGAISGTVRIQDRPAGSSDNTADAPSARSTVVLDVDVSGALGDCDIALSYHIHDSAGHYDPTLACSAKSGNPSCISQGSWETSDTEYLVGNLGSGTLSCGRLGKLESEPNPVGQCWQGGCVAGSSAYSSPHDGYTCDSSNPLTCEVGDLSGKHGKVTPSASGKIAGTYKDDYLPAASLLVSTGTKIAFHCNTTVVTADLEATEVDNTTDTAANSAACSQSNDDASLAKVSACAVAHLQPGAEDWAALAQCAADEEVCGEGAGFAALSDCTEPLSHFVSTSDSLVAETVGELNAYMCQSFVATFEADTTNTGESGVSGTVVVSPSGLRMDLDFSATDWELVGGRSCYASGLEYHIHTNWNPSEVGKADAHSLFGMDQQQAPVCGPAVTSLHYDPTAACSRETTNPYCLTLKQTLNKEYGWLLNPDEEVEDMDTNGTILVPGEGAVYRAAPCVAGSSALTGSTGYNCTTASFNANPFACEVGDFAGKHGHFGAGGGDFNGIITKSISDPWLPPASVFTDSFADSSIVFHCGGGGARVLCAHLVAPPPKTTVSPTNGPTPPPTPKPTADDSLPATTGVAIGFGAFAGVAIIGIAGYALVKGTGAHELKGGADYLTAASTAEEGVAPRALPKAPVVAHNAL